MKNIKILIFLSIFSLVTYFWFSNKDNFLMSNIDSKQGIYEFTEWNEDELYRLKGEWEFYPKQFIDENPNRELNENLWIKDKNIEIATNESYRMGQLEQDEKGHYHIGKYVLQYRKIHGNYDIGDKLEITKSIENTSTTKDKYPFFAISFKQI